MYSANQLIGFYISGTNVVNGPTTLQCQGDLDIKRKYSIEFVNISFYHCQKLTKGV